MASGFPDDLGANACALNPEKNANLSAISSVLTNQNKITNRARFRCSCEPSWITLLAILPPLKRGPNAISTRKSSARTLKAAGLLDAASLDGTYDKWMI
jgi:hypothetical protein